MTTKDGRPRVAFLFGAGASSMPSTGEITEKVLSGAGVSHHNADCYYFGPPLYAHMGLPDEYVPKITIFLEYIRDEISEYFGKKRAITYEDLYSFADQINDCETGEHDNPAVYEALQKARGKIETAIEAKPLEIKQQWNLWDISRETTNYIHDIVYNMLWGSDPDEQKLAWLVDACEDCSVNTRTIFTLNHDTSIESCLRDAQIRFNDGFDIAINGRRQWRPDTYGTLNQCDLIKIHGSVDWYEFQNMKGGSGSTYLAMSLSGKKYHFGTPDEVRQYRPVLLIGTINKLLRYTSGVFVELYYRMYSTLKCIDHMVVGGYSFNDKAINNRIIHWLQDSSRHRMIIIHPSPESLCFNARPALRRILGETKSEGQVRYIKKRIEDVSWQNVKDRIRT